MMNLFWWWNLIVLSIGLPSFITKGYFIFTKHKTSKFYDDLAIHLLVGHALALSIMIALGLLKI